MHTFSHQEILGKTYSTFYQFIKEHNNGKLCISPFKVNLPNNHIFVSPDLFFVRKERISIITDEQLNDIPDLIVEITSKKGTIEDEINNKMEIYSQNGVPEFWLILPSLKIIGVFELKDQQYNLFSHAFNKGAVYSKILDGFELYTNSLFA